MDQVLNVANAGLELLPLLALCGFVGLLGYRALTGGEGVM